ncbi:MAG: hemolysin family protein [Arachnia sp.]
MSAGLTAALIGLLILIGGVFSAAEMAIVTLRESQVRRLAVRGSRGRALERLTKQPNLFLSAVQIGVTVSGFLSATVGGATLSSGLADAIQALGVPNGISDSLAVVIITLTISYFSIVVGELTAKRLAMQRAEAFALALAPLVSAIATVARPLIWFLGASTDALVRVLGGDPAVATSVVSAEELRTMVTASPSLGAEERSIVDEVFEAGDLSLREVMVPRTEVDFLPGATTIQRAHREVWGAPHSRYPVTDGSADKVIGFVHVRDLVDPQGAARPGTVRSVARQVLNLPETVKVLPALSAMRGAGAHLAVVRDEYGGVAGIVTLEDLVEELIGDITDEYDNEPWPEGAGVNQIDGLTTIEEFSELTGYVIPDGPYDTVAGFLMNELGTVPSLGCVAVARLDPSDPQAKEPGPRGLRLSVDAMDGRRASLIGVQFLSSSEGGADG